MFHKISLEDINKDNLINFACTDLGAFTTIGKNNLQNSGVTGVVIMEDRIPDFFILYDKYQADADTTLNRHGPFKDLYTQKHLKELVKELQNQNIKVFLGFWGQLYDPHKNNNHNFQWMKDHPELWTLHRNDRRNSDIDALAFLQKENISFAQFIVNQFIKFKNDFNFNGLFLGDGLNGYRLFVNPHRYEDKEESKEDWTNFYKTISTGIHQLNCQLLAYDCLGLKPGKAILHGADYLAQAKAGLDYIIVQTYPTAWGKKWLKNHHGFDFKSCQNNLEKTYNKLKNTNCKVLYTLEMGDRIEEWKAKARITKKQLKYFQKISHGKLLVWANELFYRLLTK